MVYVLNVDSRPLMPCTEAKAKHLLKARKAVIVNRTPFTIRLAFVVDDITQPVTLGVDAGRKKTDSELYQNLSLFLARVGIEHF